MIIVKEEKRYRVECAVCGYTVIRSKRDAAAHVMAQHVAYAHDGRES